MTVFRRVPPRIRNRRFPSWVGTQGFKIAPVGGIINDATRVIGRDGDALYNQTIAGYLDPTTPGNTSWGLLHTNNVWQAQSFVSSISTSASSLDLHLMISKEGSPTDNLIFEIYSDSSDFPGSLLATTSFSEASPPSSGNQTWMVSFTNVTLQAGTTYWLSAHRSGSTDSTNYIAVSAQTGTSYGTSKRSTDSGATWDPSTGNPIFTFVKPGGDSSYGLWRSSTNLVPNGGFESNITGWSNGTRITTDSKFGNACMDLLVPSADQNTLSDRIAVNPSSSYICSAFIKSSSKYRLEITWYTSALAIISISTSGTLTGNGSWRRDSISATSPSNAAFASININDQAFSTNTYPYDFYIDGVQFEAQPYATPYIETNGASASRAAGHVNVPARLLSVSQGWISLRFRPHSFLVDSVSRRLFTFGADSSNFFLAIFATGATPFLRIQNISGGSVVGLATLFPSSSPSEGDVLTATFSWNASNLNISYNGSSFTSGGRGAGSFAGSNLAIGDDFVSSTGAIIDSEVLWVAAGTGTLSDADAATIHGFGDAGSAINYPALSAPTIYWPADTDVFYVPTISTGALVTATLAASVVGSPVLIHNPTKVLAPTVVGSPSIVRAPTRILVPTAIISSPKVVKQPSRTFSLTVVGNPTASRTPQRILNVTTISSATVIRSPGKVLQGVGATVATLTRSGAKVLNAITVTAPAIIKQPIRTLSASITTVASITARLVVTRVLSAVVGTTATISRSAVKVLTATVGSTAVSIRNPLKTLATTVVTVASRTVASARTFSTTVTAIGAIRRVSSRTLSATTTATATVVRTALKILAASIAVVASRIVSVSHALVAVAVAVPKTIRNVSHTIAASATGIPNITRGGITLSATVGSVATSIRNVARTTTASVTVTTTRVTNAAHTLFGAVTTTSDVDTTTSRRLVASVTIIPRVGRSLVRSLASSVIVQATINSLIVCSLIALVTTAPAMVRKVSRTISGSAATVATIQRGANIVTRTIAATVGTSAKIATLPSKTLTVTTVVVASVARSVTRTITATSVVVPRVIRNIGRILDIATTNVTSSVVPSVTRSLNATSVVVATVASSIANTIWSTVVMNPIVERVLTTSRTAVATSVAVVEKSPVVSLLTTATASATLAVRQLTRLFVDLIARMQGRAYSAVAYRRFIAASFKEWSVTQVFRSWIAKIPFRRYSERFWK